MCLIVRLLRRPPIERLMVPPVHDEAAEPACIDSQLSGPDGLVLGGDWPVMNFAMRTMSCSRVMGMSQ